MDAGGFDEPPSEQVGHLPGSHVQNDEGREVVRGPGK